MTALSPGATDVSKTHPLGAPPPEARSRRARRAIAMPGNLALLAAVCMGCGLILSAGLLLHHAGKERRAIEAQAMAASHAVAKSLDREIAAAEARLEALASSPA